MTVDATPSWLNEACPSWCVRTHLEDDHPDDRRHQGEAEVLTLLLAEDAIPSERTTSVEVVVLMDRPVGGAQDWIRIEATEQARPRIAFTAESARDLQERLRGATRDRDLDGEDAILPAVE
ncbi:DUF6907 domain-containing protein [Nocardioides montaniterrae]